MRLLDRHLLRSFLLPFTYCELGFFMVWLIFDLSTNVNDFMEARVSPLAILGFYLGQAPAILVLTLPVGLLLALLYSLSKLSQANEIISMLGAGVSLGRVLGPFFAVGILVSLGSTALNYRLAPEAEARRERELAELQSDRARLEKRAFTEGYLFANRTDRRLWFIQRMPADLLAPLEGVQIVQQDAAGHIVEKRYAPRAAFNETTRTWTLSALPTPAGGAVSGGVGGVTRAARFDARGDLTGEEFPPTQTLAGWSETPWRIASATLQADHLSVPELREYLRLNGDFTQTLLAPYRTYFHYRWALPWACLVTVLIAAPLGVVYSRRSVLAGVASSIFIFFLILFLDNLFRALGRGDRVPAFWAAWTPELLFAAVGLVLLRVRALNRDRLPLTPARLWDFLTAH